MLVWECNWEDCEIISEKDREFQEEREKFPDKYPKRTLPNKSGYWLPSKIGKVWKGFILYDVENEEQMINFTLFWSSVYQMEWIPIISRPKAMIPFVNYIKKRKII